MNRKQKGAKQLIVSLGGLLYAVGVIYGDIMFLSIVQKAFPSGFLGTMAMVGAFIAGGTALLLPFALHWWHAEGLQQYVGYGFYIADLAILGMNAILGYKLSTNAPLDSIFAAWFQICPATPVICTLGWGLTFALDPSHQMRHAQQGLEADQIEMYAQGLREAAKSPKVRQIIETGAQLHAEQHVAQLLKLPMSYTQALPSPTVNSTAQALPQTGELPAMQSPQQKDGFFSKVGKWLGGNEQPVQEPPHQRTDEELLADLRSRPGFSEWFEWMEKERAKEAPQVPAQPETKPDTAMQDWFELYKKSGESGVMSFPAFMKRMSNATNPLPKSPLDSQASHEGNQNGKQ